MVQEKRGTEVVGEPQSGMSLSPAASARAASTKAASGTAGGEAPASADRGRDGVCWAACTRGPPGPANK
eukprot:9939259-Prorocentrum_lima.AAC.1